MLIGSCATVRGQVTGSLPVNSRLPNSTSATPSPSLPGSQLATSASMLLSMLGGMIMGRPETTSTTHLAALAHTVFTAVRSASESFMVFGGRGTLLSPGSNAHCGPPTSPNPSAYGVSPTTTTPTAPRGTGLDASWLNVTVREDARWIPWRIVAPGITFV